MNDRERFLATMNYQARDRCPWGEMGFWPETLERWHQEGWPEDVYLNQFFGFDRLRDGVPISLEFEPAFKSEVLEETEHQMADFLAYLGEAVEARRANPGDDVLSRIVEAADAGVIDDDQRLHRMDGDEVRDFALFLLIAGNETTRNGISQGMLALFEHPEERARLANMEEALHARIIDQDEGVRAVSEAVRYSRAGLADPRVLALSEAVVLVDTPDYSRLFPAERWAHAVIDLADGAGAVQHPIGHAALEGGHVSHRPVPRGVGRAGA